MNYTERTSQGMCSVRSRTSAEGGFVLAHVDVEEVDDWFPTHASTHTPTHTQKAPSKRETKQPGPSGFYILFNVFCFLINRQEWKRLLSVLNKLRVQTINFCTLHYKLHSQTQWETALYTLSALSCTLTHPKSNSQHLIFFWNKTYHQHSVSSHMHTTINFLFWSCPSPPPAPPTWHCLQHNVHTFKLHAK